MVVAYIAATVLEVVGLAFAGVGFVRTWREHAAGQDFWQPLKARWTGFAERVAAVARKVFRRRRDARVVAGTASATASVPTVRVHGKVGWPPLPDPSNPEELVAEVHARLNHLRWALQDHQFALDDERTAREEGDDAVRSALEGEIGAVAAATERVAVGGLWPQVVGWSLVLLGIVVGGAANVVQAWTS